MRFSIIIPTYNAEKTMNRCIDSILLQTFTDYEVIIINDGSTDKSLDIITYYTDIDKRIKYINQNNKGVSSARNEGILHSEGDYLVFIDSDDYIEPDYLENLSRSQADIVVCGYKTFGKVVMRDAPKKNKLYLGDDVKNQLTSNINKSYYRTPWCKAFKRVLFLDNKILYDTKIRFGEDTELNFRIVNYAKSLETLSYEGYNYYYGNPFSKWILQPKEYSYSIKKMFQALNNLKVDGVTIAKNDVTGCFMNFFFIGLWNAPFKISISLSIGYLKNGLYKYMPYKGIFKFRKLMSIILIPYINIFRRVKFE